MAMTSPAKSWVDLESLVSPHRPSQNFSSLAAKVNGMLPRVCAKGSERRYFGGSHVRWGTEEYRGEGEHKGDLSR
jgi:hypothetical protein